MCRSDRLLQHAGLRETDRHTLEGPNHHANRVDGRGWASGAYFGALAVVMVVGGIGECSLPYFHVLKGLQSNWSVANRDPGCKGNRIFATFLATSRQFATRDTVSDRLRTTRKTDKTSGMDDVLVFLRGLYVGISIACGCVQYWVAKVAQRTCSTPVPVPLPTTGRLGRPTIYVA